MSLCPLCGYTLAADREICMYHGIAYGAEWAAGNRIYCDFFHRGRVAKEPDADRP